MNDTPPRSLSTSATRLLSAKFISPISPETGGSGWSGPVSRHFNAAGVAR
jgi:hypothetical protein